MGSIVSIPHKLQRKKKLKIISDLFTSMSELFSIKQEPELDIFSDGEGDQLSVLSTGNEDSIECSDRDTLNEPRNGHLDCTSVHDIYSINIKSEQNDNNNDWTICDSTKSNSFQCYICSKTYSTKQTLKLHIQSVHMLLRPFKCQLCLRSFADKYTLTTHTRIHSGERPYACPYCEKTFVQHSAVTKHKRTHTNEKPFQCEVCLKAFSDRSSLIPHRKIHTGDFSRPFRCDICNADFIKNSHLVRHNKTKSHLREVAKCNDVQIVKCEASQSTELNAKSF